MSAPVPPAEASPTDANARQLALLLALQFAFGIAFSIFLLLPKIFATALHAGPGGIGLVHLLFGGICPACAAARSMFSLAGFVAVPLVGARVDRPGRARFIVAGTLLMAVTSLGYLVVDRVGPLALVLRAAHGAAYTIVFVTGAALAADLSAPRAHGAHDGPVRQRQLAP